MGKRLLGLSFNALGFEDAVALLLQTCDTQQSAQVVVTPNVDHIVSLEQNATLKAQYSSADFIFADGMPVVWASRLLGKPLPERVTGADLFTALCQEAQARNWPIAVIGGLPGQESLLQQRFEQVYPELQLSLYCPPMGFDPTGITGQQCLSWVNDMADKTPFKEPFKLVFVCLGFPRQDIWALQVRDQIHARLVLGVGASMEFALGLTRRAPRWMQRSGLEWVWRLLTQPRKLWRRYLLKGPRFVGIVWREWKANRRSIRS